MKIQSVPQQRKSLSTRGILNNSRLWLKQKAQFDNKLWRNQPNTWVVHNKVYDLNQFVQSHPGGAHWIQNTRGHDITTLFYVHHLDESKVKKVLQKYYVRDCQKKAQIFTFKEDGLYKTIKRRVLSKFSIKEIQDQTQTKKLTIIILALFLIAFLVTCITRSYLMAAVSGYIMVGIVGLGHNFMHHKKTALRYLYEFTGFGHKEWESMHAISHHVLSNTEQDYQIGAFQPLVYFLRTKPQNYKFVQIYLQFFYFLMIPINMVLKIVMPLVKGNKFDFQNLLPYTQLLILYLFNRDLKQSLLLFFFMQAFFGFIFTKCIFCGHRPQQLWTEGCQKIEDYGEHILASTCDTTTYIVGFSSFMLFAGFNNHVAHHLFPTADHSQLHKILPIIIETCKEFNVEYRCKSKWQCMVEVSKAMIKRVPYISNKKKV